MTGDDFDLNDAYAVETPDDNRELYARWADSYDDGFLATHGYIYHQSVVGVLARRADPATAGAVLDVGCGTGVVGIELRARGFVTVDGIDLSPEMLAVASTKTVDDGSAVYRRLIEADLTEPLPTDLGHYEALVSAGTFTHGHLGPGPIGQLLSLLEPGSPAAIGVNAEHFETLGFRVELERLEQTGVVDDVELVDAPMYDADRYEADDPEHMTVSTVVLVTVQSEGTV